MALAIKLACYCPFALLPLLAGMAGLFSTPRSLETGVCGAAWLFTIVAYAPGFVEYRYFFPAVPPLLVTAAFGCEAGEQMIGRLRRRAAGAHG